MFKPFSTHLMRWTIIALFSGSEVTGIFYDFTTVDDDGILVNFNIRFRLAYLLLTYKNEDMLSLVEKNGFVLG